MNASYTFVFLKQAFAYLAALMPSSRCLSLPIESHDKKSTPFWHLKIMPLGGELPKWNTGICSQIVFFRSSCTPTYYLVRTNK